MKSSKKKMNEAVKKASNLCPFCNNELHKWTSLCYTCVWENLVFDEWLEHDLWVREHQFRSFIHWNGEVPPYLK